MTLLLLLHLQIKPTTGIWNFHVNLFSKGVNDSGKLVTSDKVTKRL
jgi:hypothetical protein